VSREPGRFIVLAFSRRAAIKRPTENRWPSMAIAASGICSSKNKEQNDKE